MANRPELKVTLCQYARNAVAHRALSTWFAIQEGPSSFAIFDTFNDEAGRDAHLNSKVAAALMAKAGELLVKPPAIHKIDILTDKLPK